MKQNSHNVLNQNSRVHEFATNGYYFNPQNGIENKNNKRVIQIPS